MPSIQGTEKIKYERTARMTAGRGNTKGSSARASRLKGTLQAIARVDGASGRTKKAGALEKKMREKGGEN